MKDVVSNFMDFCLYQVKMKQHWRVFSKEVTGSSLSFRRLIMVDVWRMTVVGTV